MAKMTLDYSFSSAKYVEGGITADILDAKLEKARYGFSRLADLTQSQKVGFAELPNENVDGIKAVAKEVYRKFNDLVIIGIGGSSLGFEAIVNALLPHGYNSLSFGDRRGYPRVWLLDNADPSLVGSVMKFCKQADTFVIVISKSGYTVEMAANFMAIMEWLKSESIIIKKHVAVITEKDRGALSEFAAENEVQLFPVPPNVGGRYSVLSPVGLLPAAIMGIDIGKMLAGAASVTESHWTHFLTMAAVYMHFMENYSINVLMPYSSKLIKFSEWFCQLWGESLGKESENAAFTSTTPIGVVGAVDQHSQIQQFLGGARDKFTTFIGLGIHDYDMTLKGDATPSYQYLVGNRMGDLLNSELIATETSLVINGRPSMKLSFSSLDEFSLGQLFMMYEYIVSIIGLANGIDPFDQPAVEEGKRIVYGLMGHEEYSAIKEILEKYARSPEFII